MCRLVLSIPQNKLEYGRIQQYKQLVFRDSSRIVNNRTLISLSEWLSTTNIKKKSICLENVKKTGDAWRSIGLPICLRVKRSQFQIYGVCMRVVTGQQNIYDKFSIIQNQRCCWQKKINAWAQLDDDDSQQTANTVTVMTFNWNVFSNKSLKNQHVPMLKSICTNVLMSFSSWCCSFEPWLPSHSLWCWSLKKKIDQDLNL